MKKENKSTVLLTIIFLVGLSLLLYPSFSDYWNSFRQSRAIAGYLDSVNAMDNARYDELLEQARAYNAGLANKSDQFTLTEEEEEEFLSLLGSTGGAVGYIEVESIKLTLPIYMGTSEGVLQVGVGTLEGASLPIGGDSVHAVLTGHRGLPSATLFTHLDKLVEGDIFYVHILNETTTYEVDQILIVEPHEMDSLKIEQGQNYCTLVTCTPYGINSHRLLIRGHRIETPADALFVQVSADAMQIEPIAIAPLIAVPLLLALLVLMLVSGRSKKEKKVPESKKGGNSGEDTQKMDG